MCSSASFFATEHACRPPYTYRTIRDRYQWHGTECVNGGSVSNGSSEAYVRIKEKRPARSEWGATTTMREKEKRDGSKEKGMVERIRTITRDDRCSACRRDGCGAVNPGGVPENRISAAPPPEL